MFNRPAFPFCGRGWLEFAGLALAELLLAWAWHGRVPLIQGQQNGPAQGGITRGMIKYDLETAVVDPVVCLGDQFLVAGTDSSRYQPPTKLGQMKIPF